MPRFLSKCFVIFAICLSLLCIRNAAHAQDIPPRVGSPGGGHANIARSVSTYVPPSAEELATALDIPIGQLVNADLGTSDGQGTAVFVDPAHGFPVTGGSYTVLSTGHAPDTFLPNNEPDISTELTGLNNSQGNDLVQLSLTLAVPVGASEWAVDFKFFSEEFPEYVGSIYNDAFLIETPLSTFVISEAEISAPNNVALDPDGRQVTINSVGPGGMTAANAASTTYDGATGKLTAVAPIPTGASQIKIVFSVTDLGDSIYDTTVFLDNFRFILGTIVSYTPSASDFPNPERGFYHHTETHSTGYTPLNLTTLEGYRQNENISLILRLFYLDDFTTAPISQAYLDAMEADFDTLRQAGLKAVVRFAYTNQLTFASGTSWPPIPPYGDADEAQILAHLEQLRPLLNKHRDVIAVVQAGFAGIWGEWYYTDHFVADPNIPWNVTPADYANRGDLLRGILDALPVDRMAQVRTPLNKQQIYGTGTGAASALSSSDARNTSDIARTGHHNDCFLASETDYGTYADITQDKAYLAEESKFLPMGGETCNDTTDDDDPLTPAVDESSDRSLCPTALAELAEFHWSYLNWDYHSGVRDRWAADRCLDEIKQRLGYRLTLLRGAYNNAVKPGGEFTIDLDLRNDGWAAPYNPRLVELLLRNQSSGNIYSMPLPDDPRGWLADSGGEYSINRTICAPASMPAGSYSLLLNLPDPEAGVYSRPDYAIRLANDGMWEATTGFNDLGHTVVVDPAASSAVCTTPLVLRPRGANTYRVIRFAGRDWVVKSGSGKGPGPNDWSNDERSVWVDDAGRLHLKIRQIGDIWHSAEVNSVDYTQEGLHRFYITTPDVTPENTPRLLDNLDKRVVAAPFVYAADNLEVDMEFTRWGEDAPGYDAQYAIQPDPEVANGNLHRFLMALSGRDSTHEFDWSSSGATFKSFNGHTTDVLAQLQQQTLTGGNVPTTTNNLRIHINLWLDQWFYLFQLGTGFVSELDADIDISTELRDEFQENGVTLGEGAVVIDKEVGKSWMIGDGIERYGITHYDPEDENETGWLNVFRRRWNPPSDGRPTEIIVSDIEAPPGNNTKWGELIPVSFPGVGLQFAQILGPGNTTLTTSDEGPPLPTGLTPGNPPIYYDIHTTAEFAGSVTVCIDYDPTAFANEAALGLFHYDGTDWENITLPGYPDTVNGLICGLTDSFSTFTVLESTNLPPTADVGGTYSVPEGGSIPLEGSGIDPENGTLTFSWDLDSDGIFETVGQNPTFSAVGRDGPDSQNVVLQVCDQLNACTTATATVEITNVAPDVSAPSIAPEPSVEGGIVTASATFSDQGVNDAPFICTINYGDGSGEQPGTVSGNTCTGPAHPYADDGSYLATITVADNDTASGVSPAATHQVNNVAPTITDLTPGTIGPVDINDQPFAVGVNWTDPGTADTHEVMWSWGDGSTDDTQSPATSGASQGHTYADPGIYPVTVTVTDDNSGTDTGVFEFVVIYGPLQWVMSAPAFDQSIFANSYVTGGATATINGDVLTGLYLTTGDSARINGDTVAVAATTLGPNGRVTGDVRSGAAITLGPGANVNGSRTPNSTAATVTTEPEDVLAAQTFLSGLTPTFVLLPGNIATNVTFTAGVHEVTGLLTVAAGKTITLDAQNQDGAEFIFNISNYLAFGAGVNVVVTNGGANARVIWNATGGYITVGAGADIIGTVLAYEYVSTGADSVLSGVGSSCGGAVYSATSYVSVGAGATVGTGSDCAQTSRTSISGLSDWTTGENLVPTAVDITDFSGSTAWGSGPTLNWETANANESGLTGFHIWRGSTDAAETRLTDTAIGAAGGGLNDSEYTWQDAVSFGWGQRSYYWLEAVNADESSTFTGPVEVVGIGKLFLPAMGR